MQGEQLPPEPTVFVGTSASLSLTLGILSKAAKSAPLPFPRECLGHCRPIRNSREVWCMTCKLLTPHQKAKHSRRPFSNMPCSSKLLQVMLPVRFPLRAHHCHAKSCEATSVFSIPAKGVVKSDEWIPLTKLRCQTSLNVFGHLRPRKQTTA